jgi:hypothetical protein
MLHLAVGRNCFNIIGKSVWRCRVGSNSVKSRVGAYKSRTKTSSSSKLSPGNSSSE